MTVKFTLYMRNGCHLCDDVATELAGLRPAIDFDWESVDINQHSELVVRYGEKVPVLALGDEVICVHFFDQQAFLGAIQAAGQVK